MNCTHSVLSEIVQILRGMRLEGDEKDKVRKQVAEAFARNMRSMAYYNFDYDAFVSACLQGHEGHMASTKKDPRSTGS